MRIIQLFVLSTLLTACASIPLKTVYNLWNFDPWTSDQREWRAAVRLPAAADSDLDKARVTMKVETWREGAAAKETETFVLVRSKAAQDVNPLAAEARKGFVVAAYMFAPGDHPRLMALKTRVLAAKGTATPIRGAINISAQTCDPTKPKPAGPYPVSTYLMVNRADGYNPLVVDYDLGPELRKAPSLPGIRPECE